MKKLSSLPAGDETRKALLAGLKSSSEKTSAKPWYELPVSERFKDEAVVDDPLKALKALKIRPKDVSKSDLDFLEELFTLVKKKLGLSSLYFINPDEEEHYDDLYGLIKWKDAPDLKGEEADWGPVEEGNLEGRKFISYHDEGSGMIFGDKKSFL